MWAKTYDKKYRLNKRTGKNFDLLMEKVTPLVIKLARRYQAELRDSLEDVIQDIYVLALEAIQTFNSKKGVKFSTFLHVHLENKLITKVRHVNTQKNNASLLRHIDEVREDGTIYSRSPRTLNFEVGRRESPGDHETGEGIAPESSSLFYSKNQLDIIDFRLSLDSLLKIYHVPQETVKVIESMYLKDENISDCLPAKPNSDQKYSAWAISVRLKNLAKKTKFRELKMHNQQSKLPANSHLGRIFHVQ
jgi:RNA polymerase sigma factor (sigma-70 family)